MKNLTLTTLILCTFLAIHPVNAKAHDRHSPKPPAPPACPPPSTKLPIDGQALWLAVAGMVVGCVVIRRNVSVSTK